MSNDHRYKLPRNIKGLFGDSVGEFLVYSNRDSEQDFYQNPKIKTFYREYKELVGYHYIASSKGNSIPIQTSISGIIPLYILFKGKSDIKQHIVNKLYIDLGKRSWNSRFEKLQISVAIKSLSEPLTFQFTVKTIRRSKELERKWYLDFSAIHIELINAPLPPSIQTQLISRLLSTDCDIISLSEWINEQAHAYQPISALTRRLEESYHQKRNDRLCGFWFFKNFARKDQLEQLRESKDKAVLDENISLALKEIDRERMSLASSKLKQVLEMYQEQEEYASINEVTQLDEHPHFNTSAS